MIDVFPSFQRIRSEFLYLHPSGQTPSAATDSTLLVHVVDGTRDAEVGSRPSCPGARGTSELSRFVTKILADGWHILHQRNALEKKPASTYHGLQNPGAQEDQAQDSILRLLLDGMPFGIQTGK
jgi:hypothetical protein